MQQVSMGLEMLDLQISQFEGRFRPEPPPRPKAPEPPPEEPDAAPQQDELGSLRERLAQLEKKLGGKS
jgi:hypothetical protein